MLNTHKRHSSTLGKGLNETSEKKQYFSKDLQLVSETGSTGDKPEHSMVNCKEHDFKMTIEVKEAYLP